MNQETKVGLFILAALAALLPSIFFVGNIKIFKRTHTYYADFSDVQALPPKAAVKVAGVEIGKVGSIKLIDGKARVEIEIDPKVHLHEDAKARIGSTGIIGTRFVELDPGTASLPTLAHGSVIFGDSGSSIEKMMSSLTSLFDKDAKYGDAVVNLKATIANIRNVSEALNGALGEKRAELSEIVMNIRDLTASAKSFTKDLEDVVSDKKEEIRSAIGKLHDASEKLDSILGKIDRGEGTIGTLVSDKKTEADVKEAITSIKDTAASAKSVLGRFRNVNTYWDVRYRYGDSLGHTDLAITIVPRPGKFYAIGATNVGQVESGEKHFLYERHNRFLAVMGADYGSFTGYAGVIRARGGAGINFRPLWFNKEYNRRAELTFEVSDPKRDIVINGERFDKAWVATGGRFAVNRWMWLGVRWEDILERSVFMTNVNIVFRDVDLAYLFGLASVSRP